ncbi:phage holin family protein [Sabulicella glaciei]|uniref:Phage holin family protein n=1 Tax=Sabulicella glaciei TaxID=2984948 RepID=A0ABT3NX20_9PROT|nr:phage holin family protein [Roseococcus sp. MDT2-1-1]MCW8086671.1 phage holin family protein [Roseococcus sp. MDT2-1-1]
MRENTERSVADLLGDLVDQTTTLVRKEVQLARAELGEKAGQVSSAVISLGAGMVLAIGALIALTQAAIAALVEYAGLSATVSALIVAAVLALIGFLVVRGGIATLRSFNITPDRTATQLSRDAQVVKEQVR